MGGLSTAHFFDTPLNTNFTNIFSRMTLNTFDILVIFVKSICGICVKKNQLKSQVYLQTLKTFNLLTVQNLTEFNLFFPKLVL